MNEQHGVVRTRDVVDLDWFVSLLQRAESDMRLLDGRDFDADPWEEVWRLVGAIRAAQESRLAPLVNAIYVLLVDEKENL